MINDYGSLLEINEAIREINRGLSDLGNRAHELEHRIAWSDFEEEMRCHAAKNRARALDAEMAK